MAFKVLGQTLTTAASANIVVNLIKDPSFEGATREIRTGATTSSDTSWVNVAGTQWWWVNAQGSYFNSDFLGEINTNTTATTAYLSGGYTTRYGSKVLGFGSTSQSQDYNGSGNLAYGLSTSGSMYSFDNSRFGGVSRSIPVTGSTVYYYGFDHQGVNISTSYFRILWFDSNSSYLTQNSINPFPNGSSQSTWARSNFTVTSPSNAAYAGIQFMPGFFRYNSITLAVDGFYFGTVASAGSVGVFPDPATGGTNSTLTAPFTGRFTAVHSGTVNNSTTIENFAGVSVDLYTVPASKEAVVSTITVANPTLSATSYRIAVVPSGETLAIKNWIAFDIPLAANATTTLTLGLTLSAGDKIQVSNDTAQVAFTAFGSEN